MPTDRPSFRYLNSEPRPPQPPQQRPAGTPPMVVLAILIAALALCAAVIGGGVCFAYRMAQTLPTVSQLESIQQPLVSRVLARDGSVLHEFSTERRFWVSIDSMPPDLYHAVVAIEDRRFYEHWGIDVRRILGAVLIDVVARDYAQGASTITQQLARNLYLTARQSMVRKVREIMTAAQIESYYTKREILELYLNQVYLGAGCYGMEAASQRYFSKPVSQLSLAECATLAGAIQLPERYRPDRPDNIRGVTIRRNSVLRGMRRMGVITAAAEAEASREPVSANPHEPAAKNAPYFIAMVRQYVSERYGDDLLYEGGLTIYSTLDPMAQDSAEVAATAQLAVLQRRLNRMCVDSSRIFRDLGLPRDTVIAHFDTLYRLHRKQFDALGDSVKLRRAQTAVVALDVQTGGILLLIGGKNFEESKFNRATQSFRQPGSAFKPFVYTVAIDSGMNPSTEVLDQAVTLTNPDGTEWRPENFDREFYGPVTIRKALYKSINLPAIQVLIEVGPKAVVELAHRMGITTDLAPVPSLAIGSCEVIPIEIISAYGVFPDKGARVDPYFVERIVDKNGKELEHHTVKTTQVISANTAFVMADMMTDVVRRGTAASIPGRGFTRPAAGKTGTTNAYSDVWFIGYTPQVVCGVWVGCDDERRSLGRGVTGADAAVPIWVPAMSALHRALPVKSFERPDSVIVAKVCIKSNKLANSYCQETRDDVFILGKEPQECDEHGGARRSSSGGDFGSSPRRDKTPRNPKRPLAF